MGGGLLVALVIKHADNILRGFSTALATVLATLGAVICFGFELHGSFFIGMLLVICSALLYGGTVKPPGSWWEEEPSCRRIRVIRKLSDKLSDLSPVSPAKAV